MKKISLKFLSPLQVFGIIILVLASVVVFSKVVEAAVNLKFYPNTTCTSSNQSSFVVNTDVCAKATGLGSSHNHFIEIYNPSSSLFATSTTGTGNRQVAFIPNACGTWTAKVIKASDSSLQETETFTVTGCSSTGTLTLLKEVINDNGGTALDTDWTLEADGPDSISGVEGDAEVTNAEVEAGTYDLSELNGPDGYDASAWVCEGGTQDDDDTVTIGADEDVTCTITNDDIAPKLTVTKIVINNDGGGLGVGDFTLYVDGDEVTSGEQLTLDAGTYTVSEDEDDGYVATFGEDCDENGDVVLGVGDVKECTITNNDIAPGLTLIKEIINDNGGTATEDDFQAYIDDGAVPWGEAQELEAGTYTLSEASEVSGYEASSWDCDGGSLDDDEVTIELGETVVCTITNDDIQPKLTVNKIVDGDEGSPLTPDDFSLFVNGDPVSNGVQVGLNAGDYTVTESSEDNYDGPVFGGDCSESGEVTLSVGDEKTCTVTNTYVAPEDEEPVYGCTDPEAINFDPDATDDDESCEYSDSGPVYVCSDGLDNDEDGAIDEEDPGCHNPSSGDYDPYHISEENPKSNDDSGGVSSGGRLGGGSSNTGGQVLGATTSELCSWPVDTFMRRGYKNNATQVRMLQQDLLNSFMNAGLAIDGVYGPRTEQAVKNFQLAKKDKILTPWGLILPTGIFYKTTLVEAKNTLCPELQLPIPTDLVPWNSV